MFSFSLYYFCYSKGGGTVILQENAPEKILHLYENKKEEIWGGGGMSK